MLIQIVILIWIFPGGGITLQEIIGMAVAAVGAVLAQFKLKKIPSSASDEGMRKLR
jgi:hypothetical protein